MLWLALALGALAAIGYVVARVALRQSNQLSALAQGMVIGPALWGLTNNFVLRLVPGGAGALVSWLLAVAVGAWLARREWSRLRMPARTLAPFAVAALALFWVALASRQLLMNPDSIHLALAASIQAGNWPPALPWNPDQAVPYHYAAALLIGLLAPPFGPDLPFTSELLGAYAWTSFVLIVGTTLVTRGGWIGALVLTPLLVTAGAWGLVIFTEVPSLLRVLVPIGLPEAGLRAALADVYLPTVSLPWSAEIEASPPNIWRPSFVLAYALAVVALERVVATRCRRWSSRLVVAGLLGFTGLLDEAVALVVLTLWILLEAGWVVHARQSGAAMRRLALVSAAGPGLAVLLLALGGGVISGVLTGSAGGGLSLGWTADLTSRQEIGSLEPLSGGLGILGLGPVAVAAIAVVLARRDVLPLTLAGAAAGFLLAGFTLQYDVAEHDVVRLDGHARNFALLALVVGVGPRLGVVSVRRRVATATLCVLAVTWPSVSLPMGGMVAAVGHGVQIGNAAAWPEARGEAGWHLAGRQRLVPFGSDAVTGWLRTYTAADARVLSPLPHAMTANTGRPNASGFTGFVHLFPQTGPAYEDAMRHLEPAALRRLGITHVHVPDSWAAGLPDQATGWLERSAYFELVARGDTDALYRVLPALLQAESSPAAGSFEALRQVVPDGSTVYLARDSDRLAAIHVAAALPHARLFGSVRSEILHPLTGFHLEPLGDETPDLIVTSMQLTDSVVASGRTEPVWWNENVLVFGRDESIGALMARPEAPKVDVRLSDLKESNQSVEFRAIFSNRTDDQWTGQDWLVISRDASLLALARNLRTGPIAQWFDGQIEPKPGTIALDY